MQINSSTNLTAHRRSLKALTGIRFFAAAYVVLYHTHLSAILGEHGHRVAANFLHSGYLAVPLFFILSGFILAYTYKGQIETTSDHFRFWEARIARIWPVYIVSLLTVSLVSRCLPSLNVALATICMIQAWIPGAPQLAGAWNYVCWTLSVEAFFYLVFPWVQGLIERLNVRAQFIVIGLMLAFCVALNSGVHIMGYSESGILYWVPLPVLHLGEFFTGVGLGNLFLRRLNSIADHTLVSSLLGSGTWTYTATAATLALLCLPVNRLTSAVIIAFAALVYGLAAERTFISRFLSTPALALGGGISYSMYLMQYPVRLGVTNAMSHFGVSRNEILIVILIVLLLVSLLMFKAIENPARHILRALFRRFQQPRAAAR